MEVSREVKAKIFKVVNRQIKGQGKNKLSLIRKVFHIGNVLFGKSN